MKIEREQEVVEQFFYEWQEERDDREALVAPTIQFEQGTKSCFILLEFVLPLDKCTVSGRLHQLVHLTSETTVEEQRLAQSQAFSEILTDQLLKPLFSILSRLTYDVTEIAFDEPGIDLTFTSEN